MTLETNKVKALQLRITLNEFKKVRELAAKYNITVSEWIRRAINKGK